MKAKPALVARVNDGTGKFPRIPVKFRRNASSFQFSGRTVVSFTLPMSSASMPGTL
jgi:hypothetical protein